MVLQRKMFIFALFLAVASVSAEDPVGKVIGLLEDLQDKVKEEGKEEAKTYDKFACYCKDKTGEKSDAITDGQDTIDEESATIQEKSAKKDEKLSDLASREERNKELTGRLDEEVADCESAAAEYQANSADMEAALGELEGAIESMGGAAAGAASLLQANVKAKVQKSIEIADALGLVDEKQKAFTAFLEGGAHGDGDDDKDKGYKFHSKSIVDLLKKLEGKFKDKEKAMEKAWEEKEKSCKDVKESLSDDILENKEAMDDIKEDIQDLEEEIATAREALVEAESNLKDDQKYLTELTGRCEKAANGWDQRSSLRKNELEALSKALAVIENKVKDADKDVNRDSASASFVVKSSKGLKAAAVSVKAAPVKPVSFLQSDSARRTARNLLERVQTSASSEGRDKAVALLSAEGKRLGSPELSALATKVKVDPFVKVKNLIQKLIERLVKEATEEAEKKGFCDTELGKARSDRDYRLSDVNKLNAELSKLEAKQDFLEEEITMLTEALKQLDENLAKQTKMRAEEKEENLKQIKTAKGGLEAVTEALTVLKVFYKNAAKASSFIQTQHSPVSDDTAGAGFSGSYQGNQESSKAILGLLETIKSDFERTIKVTEESEAKAAAEFVEFDRATKADIGGKTTKKELDEEDLETTKMTITKKMGDLKTNMGLLDKALMELEELKPACIDTGMSYKERVEKREEEIEALKKALCMLDGDNVEPECK
eukprot:gnl/TRDRNA2_/TRDRNA2_176533_c3_seq1.p1 gnl/TRDRNA2_/TRDRNA2_176533_c3~~gnl/TRDRNA2_/TRDRNA2_176533_c3_seq1.p1  ORF type:complete len:718 (-),score=306.11 gnl/TRDRNA2_/TRDRNA2_176533_c3_seq1:37-2190(-)